jgi:hypothetical protein
MSQTKACINHVHLQVDAALIEQLRAGYAQLAERSARVCLPLSGGRGDGAGGRALAGGNASQEEGAGNAHVKLEKPGEKRARLDFLLGRTSQRPSRPHEVGGHLFSPFR